MAFRVGRCGAGHRPRRGGSGERKAVGEREDTSSRLKQQKKAPAAVERNVALENIVKLAAAVSVRTRDLFDSFP